MTLSDSNRSVTWDPEIKDDYPCNFKLIIKQILLGHEAAANAYNVVQVRRRIGGGGMSERLQISVFHHRKYERISRGASL